MWKTWPSVGVNKLERCFLRSLFLSIITIIFWLHQKLLVEEIVKPISYSKILEERAGHVYLLEGNFSRCQPPSPDIFNKDLKKVYFKPEAVNCGDKDSVYSGEAFVVRNGNHLHQLVDLGVPCCYQSFYPRDHDDDHITYSESCVPIRETVTVIPREIDFIQILCKNTSDKTPAYRDAFPLVHRKTPKYKIRRIESSRRLNILIIGLDATSHLNFQRHMQLSRDYLLRHMGAIALEGYSIVGSGTRTNLVPLLTGLSLHFQHSAFNSTQFAKSCVNRYPHDLNECPFIWKQFSRSGYLTSFLEDWPTFNEYWPNPFQKPPTDYYFRPYALHAQKTAPTLSHLCFGPRLAFQSILNFMESVGDVAVRAGRPHFQFTWTSRLAHDDINTLTFGDIPLLRTLEGLKMSGSMNNTVIFVMGDHGHGLGQYAKSANGQQEYQLPVAYIVLPPWFSSKFPHESRNLQGNARKMTTPFDIFKTLQHLLHLVGRRNRESTSNECHGISMLEEIPDNRTCLEAGISLKWCNLCHPTLSLDSSDQVAKIVAEFVVASVNGLSEKFGNICLRQSLRNVESVSLWDPTDVFMELCDGHGRLLMDSDYFMGNFSGVDLKGVPCELVDIAKIQLTTNPYGAFYDGEVMIIRRNQSDLRPARMFLTDDVERLDWFSVSGHCVPEVVKRYCICREPHVSTSSIKN